MPNVGRITFFRIFVSDYEGISCLIAYVVTQLAAFGKCSARERETGSPSGLRSLTSNMQAIHAPFYR